MPLGRSKHAPKVPKVSKITQSTKKYQKVLKSSKSTQKNSKELKITQKYPIVLFLKGEKAENPLLPGVTKLISMLFFGDTNWAKLLLVLK